MSTSAERSVGPIVIKIGGVTLESQAESSAMWRALVELHERERGTGGSGLVLVHGGGKAVDRLLEKLGMPTHRHEGLRVTPPEQMDVIAGVLAGTLNKRLVACINAVGGRGVGICLGDGAALEARKLERPGVDLGCVGEVTGGEAALVSVLLREGFVPVLACVGIETVSGTGGAGSLLNVNGDDAAGAVAKTIGASRLVLLTDVAGVLDGEKRVISRLDAAGIERLVHDGAITGGMIPKLRAASSTARQLGSPVTIMNGGSVSELERWARGEAVGTTIDS
jgi:acetylglutamate kinase